MSSLNSPPCLAARGLVLLVTAFGQPGCASRRAVPSPTPRDSSLQQQARSTVFFTDRAAESGIKYRYPQPSKRPLNILGTIGNGCAFLDFDQDGNLDALLVGTRVALYRGDGKGRFEDVSSESGVGRIKGHWLGCAVGDYDNDSFPDVYLSAYRGGALLHNERRMTDDGRRTTTKNETRKAKSGQEESGSRQPSSVIRQFRDVSHEAGIAPQPWGTSCAFADVDGDSRLDLYIGNYVDFGPETKPQLCEVKGFMTSCGPRYYRPLRGALYRNRDGRRFEDVTARLGAASVAGKALGVAFADLDGRGRPSLAIANDEMPGDLLVNSQSGRMENAAVSAGVAYDRDGNVHGGMGIDWGDYDNDGRLDLAVGTFQKEAKSLYHNDGEGMFTDVSAQSGFESALPMVVFGLKWLDADNDGRLDLILANGHVQDNIERIEPLITYRQPTMLFRNLDGARFEDISGTSGESLKRQIVGRGLATGDYDKDGRMDALVVDSEGAPLLLHNESRNLGHWLGIRLVGKKGNRDGFGATVTLTASGVTQIRQCQSGGSYLSASDPRLHFGIGGATRIDSLTIRWPGGAVTDLKDVAPDRYIVANEARGLLPNREGEAPADPHTR